MVEVAIASLKAVMDAEANRQTSAATQETIVVN
jgi:hypothetical protein